MNPQPPKVTRIVILFGLKHSIQLNMPEACYEIGGGNAAVVACQPPSSLFLRQKMAFHGDVVIVTGFAPFAISSAFPKRFLFPKALKVSVSIAFPHRFTSRSFALKPIRAFRNSASVPSAVAASCPSLFREAPV
jgi:hypothetical protein